MVRRTQKPYLHNDWTGKRYGYVRRIRHHTIMVYPSTMVTVTSAHTGNQGRRKVLLSLCIPVWQITARTGTQALWHRFQKITTGIIRWISPMLMMSVDSWDAEGIGFADGVNPEGYEYTPVIRTNQLRRGALPIENSFSYDRQGVL